MSKQKHDKSANHDAPKTGSSWLWASLCATALLHPLFYWSSLFYWSATSRVYAFHLIALVIAGSALIYLVSSGRWKQKPALNWWVVGATLPPLAYVSWTFIASWFAKSPIQSWWSYMQRGEGVIMWVMIAILGTGVYIALKDRIIGWHSIQKWTVFAGILMAISTFTSGQMWALDGVGLEPSTVAGLLGNQSFTGSFLLIAFFIAIQTYFSDAHGKRTKVLALILMVLCLVNPLSVNARYWLGVTPIANLLAHPASIIGEAKAAIMGLGIGGLITLFLLGATLLRKKALRIISLILLILTTAGVGYATVELFSPGSKVQEFVASNSSGSRFVYWNIAKEAARAEPIHGWGLENFIFAYYKHFKSENLQPGNLSELWVDRPHNGFLENMVTGGYLGFSLYILMFTIPMTILIVLSLKKKVKWEFSAPLVGAWIGYWAQNLSLFDVHSTMILWGLLMGGTAYAVYSATDTNKSIPTHPVPPKKIYSEVFKWSLIVILLLMAIPLVSKPWKQANVMREYVVQMTPKQRSENLLRMMDLSPVGAYYTGNDILHKIINSYIDYTGSNGSQMTPDQRALLISDIDSMNKGFEIIKKISKADYRPHFLSGIACNLGIGVAPDVQTRTRMTQCGIDNLENAIELSHENLPAYWSLSYGYLLAGQTTKALDVIREAREINPLVPKTHEYVIQFARNSGDSEALLEAVQSANKYYPEDFGPMLKQLEEQMKPTKGKPKKK